MTKARHVTFQDLEHALTTVGFLSVPTAGQHKVFRHEATDTLVLLPLVPPDSDVDGIHLAAVRRMLDERGVVESEVFDSLLRGTIRADGGSPA